MKEIEYIRAVNRVKVSLAINILAGVLDGAVYGVTKQDIGNVMSDLKLIETNLFSSYDLED